MKLWDVRTFRCAGIVDISRLAGPYSGVSDAAFSPDGRTLAAGGTRANYGVVRFWSLEDEAGKDAATFLSLPDSRIVRVDLLRNGIATEDLEVRSRLTIDEHEPLGDSLAIRGGGRAFFFDILTVGKKLRGDVIVSGKSSVSSTANVRIAEDADCVAQLKVADESTWEANGRDIEVGFDGSGTLGIASGSVVRLGSAALGELAKGHGVATVDSPGSAWVLSKRLGIGEWGSGELRISNGSRVTCDGSVDFARHSGSRGIASIGEGSTLTAAEMDVGVRGEARLVVSPGGSLSTKLAVIGAFPGSSGAAFIEGASASWTCSGSLVVGALGQAELVVRSGATVRVGGKITIGPLGKLSLLGGSLSGDRLNLASRSGLCIDGGTLAVSGHATLGGELTVDFDDIDAAVSAGTLHLITYGSHVGEFKAINRPPNLQVTPVYGDNGFDLVIRRLE